MKVEVRDDLGVFEELRPWWDAQTGPLHSPFLRTEWFETWARTRLHPGEKLHVLVVVGSEGPEAAIPLVKRGPRVRSISDGVSDVFDIVHGGDQRAVETLIRRLAQETHVVLDRVDGESPLMTSPNRPRSWRMQRDLASPFVDLSRGLDTVEQGLSKNLKKNLRRAMRRLETLGDVADAVTTGDGLGTTLHDAFELEARGWKGRIDRAVTSDVRHLDFFTLFAERAASLDWLRLATLTLDGRLIAFNYDLEYAGRMYGLLTSFDETLDPRCSPGSVLFWRTIKRAIERGVTSYEMGGDRNNEWKMMWTDQTRPRADLIGFGSSFTGRVAAKANSLRRLVAR